MSDRLPPPAAYLVTACMPPPHPHSRGGASMSDRLPPPAAYQVTACMAPPHPRGGASMSGRLPPPAASQVTTCMPPPPSVESLSNIRRILPPSAKSMMSRTGLLIKGCPSYEPPSSDLSFESVDFIEDSLDSLTKMSPIFCPTSPIISSATEFATELYASTPPVCDDPPHPPRLASQQFMSMTPSPAPPPAISRRVGASFHGRSRAGGSFAFAPPAVSAPPSPTASGGFGGSFRSKNKRFGSSAPGAQRKERKQLLLQKVEKPISRRDKVAWNELFELQHEDGYWECTDRLSSFLNLDVDFFANVFLQEKGICSLGVKAHAEILRLMATLLVLQLIRVKKLEVGQLLESLLRLKESQEPRPMYWEAVKRAVDWAGRTDRQYPCVCSRLEIGRDWESSTRQLLGCDSPHPYSPLKPVLERRMDIICHAETFC
ncbi:uncharacterized protein [Sinocyclocheilus grahami]|uniref:uncharacterized protein n=1 Tax=Sinocyclocheilus grahami TaxID=75366 RepID=UPI0007AC6C56|nr:PREDICTED: uncharacterized protein LOC107572533 [Sinocyclocheilus grahami]